VAEVLFGFFFRTSFELTLVSALVLDRIHDRGTACPSNIYIYIYIYIKVKSVLLGQPEMGASCKEI